MSKNHLSRQELSIAIGVKYTTLTDWINGNVYPRIDKIELMANYFGISKSDLVEDRTQTVPSVTPFEFEYVQKIRELDDSSRNFVMSIIDREYERNCKERLMMYHEKLTEMQQKK